MNIKRYGFGHRLQHLNNPLDTLRIPDIVEKPDGEFVRYEDHVAMLDELRAEKAGLESIVIAQAEKLRGTVEIDRQQRREPVEMGNGTVAVGSCVRSTDGVPGIAYLRVPDGPREFNTDCSDLYPIGSRANPDDILACVYFKTRETLQQTIRVLLELQSEHYPRCAAQAQEPSDDALRAVALTVPDQLPGNEWPIGFARAVLARYGQAAQSVASAEPFCYASINKHGDVTRTTKRRDGWSNVPLYVAPVAAQPEIETAERPCVDEDGCPTEKAVLQRFWRQHQTSAQPAASAEPVQLAWRVVDRETGAPRTDWIDGAGGDQNDEPPYSGGLVQRAFAAPVAAQPSVPDISDDDLMRIFWKHFHSFRCSASAVTHTKWKDGIDIDVMSAPMLAYSRELVSMCAPTPPADRQALPFGLKPSDFPPLPECCDSGPRCGNAVCDATDRQALTFDQWWDAGGHKIVSRQADRNGWKGAAEAGYIAGLLSSAAIAIRTQQKDHALMFVQELAIGAYKPEEIEAKSKAIARMAPLDARPSPELTWLYGHCKAIGMTCKSDSGKWEHDIALFTVNLTDEVAKLRAQPDPAMAGDEISDEEIDAIAASMPDGAGGMLSKWGYRQFARAVLKRVQPASREDARDAALLRAMAAEWDRAECNTDPQMPIWYALCEALDKDADGNGMRAAIDAAMQQGGDHGDVA